MNPSPAAFGLQAQGKVERPFVLARNREDGDQHFPERSGIGRGRVFH